MGTSYLARRASLPRKSAQTREKWGVFRSICQVFVMFSQYLTESPRYGPDFHVQDRSRPLELAPGSLSLTAPGLLRTCVRCRYAKNGQKKRPPEGLGRVSGLGQLDLGLVEGSEVAQGLRFVSV